MSNERHFTPELFGFLRELKANNDRDWFQANQERYEQLVREPALAFIRDFEPHLESISPHFRADDRKVGGSLFRIHRDVRFSKDKIPYKTHTGIQFRHAAGKNVHAPGYYLHLEPRRVFLGCGIWRPDGPTLQAIRTAIVNDSEGWKAVSRDRAFTTDWEFAGDSLVRGPRGFPADHELIDDLKRKDFIVVRHLTQKAVTSSTFLDELTAHYRSTGDFMRWLCDAVSVDF